MKTSILHLTTVPETLHFFRGQFRSLASHGFEVTVASAPGPALERFAEEEGTSAFAIEMSRHIEPMRDIARLKRLTGYVRSLGPAILHAHTPKAGLLGMLAASIAGVRHRFYTLHGTPALTMTGARGLLIDCSERLACQLATQVLCVSQELRRFAIEREWVSPDKVAVIGKGSANGVDSGRFRPAPEKRAQVRAMLGLREDGLLFGFLGRLAREKGIRELVEAWSTIAEEFPDAVLLLVGPDEPHDPLPAHTIRAIESHPRIVRLPFQSDPSAILAAMDVFVLPTYREGFPVSALEAASTGLPTIATAVPGCREAVVDGITGTLVPPRSASELSWAMRMYGRSQRLRELHGAAARNRAVSEFQPASIAAALADFYRAAIRTGELGSN